MANISMILGKTGTGKSTSIKNLNPEETVVVNVLKKKLPFKGSGKKYNAEAKNIFNIEDYVTIGKLLDSANQTTHIKNIIIDDSTYIMRKEFFSRAKETGFQKFSELAQHFQNIITKAEGLRDDINVFIVMHCEEVMSDGVIVGYKPSTVGKMLDDKYNPLEVVPVVLFSAVQYDDKGNATYGFYTHRFVQNGVEIPAKSPEGMFEEDFIPNDLNIVITAMHDYYE